MWKKISTALLLFFILSGSFQLTVSQTNIFSLDRVRYVVSGYALPIDPATNKPLYTTAEFIGTVSHPAIYVAGDNERIRMFVECGGEDVYVEEYVEEDPFDILGGEVKAYVVYIPGKCFLRYIPVWGFRMDVEVVDLGDKAEVYIDIRLRNVIEFQMGSIGPEKPSIFTFRFELESISILPRSIIPRDDVEVTFEMEIDKERNVVVNLSQGVLNPRFNPFNDVLSIYKRVY